MLTRCVPGAWTAVEMRRVVAALGWTAVKGWDGMQPVNN
jgi:hypothetical protein